MDASKCKHCGEFLDARRIRNFQGVKPSIFRKLPVAIACPNCGYEGYPKTYTAGSFMVELALWLCFFVPGFIYSIWRLSSRYYICPKCGCKEISRIA